MYNWVKEIERREESLYELNLRFTLCVFIFHLFFYWFSFHLYYIKKREKRNKYISHLFFIHAFKYSLYTQLCNKGAL